MLGCMRPTVRDLPRCRFPMRSRRLARRADAAPDAPAVRGAKARSFYVYYRIAADSVAARDRIGALLADVEARTGVRGTLLARSDDPTTWMETYAPVTRATVFKRVLAALVQEHGVATLTTDGRRHVEEFGPLPAPPGRAKR